MLELPSLTMPSSIAQDSSRESWKYTSAKSTECLQHLAEDLLQPRIVQPARAQDEVSGDGKRFVGVHWVQEVTVSKAM